MTIPPWSHAGAPRPDSCARRRRRTNRRRSYRRRRAVSDCSPRTRKTGVPHDTTWGRLVDHILTLAHRAPSDFSQICEVVLRNARECFADALYSGSVKQPAPVSLICAIFDGREERDLLFVHRDAPISPAHLVRAQHHTL